MHIVIAGDDEVAFRLAQDLMQNHQVVLVTNAREAAPRLARLDVAHVDGRATSPASLKEAGVAEADLFIGCNSTDEQNLISCVMSKQIGAKRTICFQFRPDAQGSYEEQDALVDSLGIDLVIRPAQQLASSILRIIAVPGALDVRAFEGGRVHLLRAAVEEGAPITRGPLARIGVAEGVVFVMASRGEERFIPKGDTHFQPGDKVTAMGSLAGINRLISRYLRTKEQQAVRREAAVVGGGHVGLAVAQGLEYAGWDVKVIESSRSRCEEIAEMLKGLVLHGDGADLDLLEEEQIGEVSNLIAVTSNDEKNLLVSLLAKNLGVKRIVTRANSASNERLFEKVGIDVVRSARGAAVQSVLREVDSTRAQLLAELEHGDAEVIELHIPKEVPPIPLHKMKSGVFAIVGAILRGGRVIIPRGGDAVQGGDRVIVFCTQDEESNTRDFFLNRLAQLAQEV